MPINLPQARGRAQGIQQCAMSALENHDADEKDCYLRDIEVYVEQLLMNITVSEEEPIVSEEQEATTRAAQASALAAFRNATMAPTTQAQPFYWRNTQTTTNPQVIQWVSDESIAALNDEPRDDAFEEII